MIIQYCAVGLMTLLTFDLVSGFDNGLALTPPMGWMSGERFQCNTDCATYPDDCLSEKLIKKQSDHLVKDGYQRAGYQYVVIGDCWSAKTRDSQGRLQADPDRFQSGMKSLADYVHSNGLKLGLYLELGNQTQHGYPGSKGHLETDAQTLADWGVDMVIMDAWNISNHNSLDNLFPEFGQYLNRTGRPILYSCRWPMYQVHLGTEHLKIDKKYLRDGDNFFKHWNQDWVDPELEKGHKDKANLDDANWSLISQTCNIFKTYPDMEDSWVDLLKLIKWFGDNSRPIVNRTRPGAWNDINQITIGDYGLSYQQQRIELSLWSVLAAPMFISADLGTVSPQSRDLLLNPLAINMSQDSLAVMGFQKMILQSNGQVRVWVRHVAPSGSFALLFSYENISGGPAKVSVKLEDLGLTTAGIYNFIDVFQQKSIGFYKPWYTFNTEVNPTGAVFIYAKGIL